LAHLVSALLLFPVTRLRQAITEPNCHIYNPPDAMFHRNQLEQKMKRNQRIPKAGFTLVEIMIVVAIIGLLAAIAIPNFVKARASSQANACINNLRQIDGAANQFALEQHKATGATLNFPGDLTPYIKLNAVSSIPGCPAGGTYSESTVGANGFPKCSLGTSVTPAHVWP
jgi:prepilin-type N-terminal cleavage/methylation domain-containing protein